MEGEGEEADAPIEVCGVHKLLLAPATKSGYVGVRATKSKKCPWQAWVHIKGERRRCLGSFKYRRDAAVARAAALACGPETLPSPRKQASRKSGAAACRPSHPPVLSCLIAHTRLTVLGSESLNGQSAHAADAAHYKREHLQLIVATVCRRRAAQRRSRTGRFRIQRPVCSVRCSECPSASARPALAPGFGSFRSGCASPATVVIGRISDASGRVRDTECARTSERTLCG